MDFITLTLFGNTEVDINPKMITAIQSQSIAPKSMIYVIGGQSWQVMETVEEIKEKIYKLNAFTGWMTGPR